METVFMIIAFVSAIVLIISVMLQDSKSAGFSAAMGGSDTGQFSKGSMEELYDRITKVSAVVWILSCTVVAVIKYAA